MPCVRKRHLIITNADKRSGHNWCYRKGDSREKRSKTGLGEGFIHPYLQCTAKQLMVNAAIGVAR